MTDFYTLLKQSIVARGISDPARRQSIYAQARSALIKQLAGQQPRLSTADITARVIDFDRAMRRIEADLQADVALAERSPAAADEAATARREIDSARDDTADEAYANPPEADREPSGWDVRDIAIEDDEPPPVEDEAPLHPALPPEPPRGRPLMRRGFTPPPALAEDEDDLPPPAPYRDQWNDEDAILADEDRADDDDDPRLGLPPPQRRLGWTLSEKDKVWVLAGAIGALALVLIGLLIYVLLPGKGGSAPTAAAVGTVSDAATADRIASAKLDVKQSFVVFDGRDPTVFQSSSDNPVHFDSDAKGSFARVGTSTASSGTKVQIGPGLAARLAGQNIRVVVTARASAERGALNLRFAYQSGVALSHWQTANLSKDYAAIGMTWVVPDLRTSPNGMDYLIIEPGIPGDGTAADIASIRIDMLGSAPST